MIYSKRIIDELTNCWYLKGWKKDDYAKTPMIQGVRQRLHIWSYETFCRPVPKNFDVDHTCSNKGCWNPQHLQSLNKSNHTKIMWERGERKDRRNQHTNKSHCVKGHEFTEENTRMKNRGARVCIKCDRIRKREWYARTNS